MIELVIVACLATGCSEKIYSEPFPSKQSCMVASQPLAAQWLMEHPQFAVIGIKCRPIEKGA